MLRKLTACYHSSYVPTNLQNTNLEFMKKFDRSDVHYWLYTIELISFFQSYNSIIDSDTIIFIVEFEDVSQIYNHMLKNI